MKFIDDITSYPTVKTDGYIVVYRKIGFIRKRIGAIYSTYHPTIPYEAFSIKFTSKRVNTIEEGVEFLKEQF